MATVPPKLVMALRRVTDFRVSECQKLLVECEGDIARVFDRMWHGLCFGYPRESEYQCVRNDFLARVQVELDATVVRADQH